MQHRRGPAVLAAMAVLGSLVGCTATDLAAAACSERTHVVTLSPPDQGVLAPYRPHHLPEPLPDGAAVLAPDAAWLIPVEGLGPAGVHYGIYLGMKDRPGHDDVCFVGGSIVVLASHEDTTWSRWHDWDAAAIITSPRAEVVGTRIYNVGDGISFSRTPAEDWAVRGVHVRQAHDDCIEADSLHGGVIEDSFLDGCFVAVSATAVDPAADGTGEVVEIRDSLIRMQPMPQVFKPDVWATPGHAAVFKWDMDQRAPDIHMHDSVIVLEQHGNVRAVDGERRWPLLPFHQPAGGPRREYLRTANCSNNTIVWLGDEDPDFEPAGGIFGNEEVIPDCFTILTGRAAREFWEAKRTEWLERHPLAWHPDRHPLVFTYDELAGR